ncbi:MAG: chemotaxis protein CheW [Candidatus Latescibacteria bacterium]|nr:chemotaxis protein CheW [Candidatus Latescibacterota bacterium]
MDILTFTVGDIQTGLPVHRLALSFSVAGAKVSVDHTGSGSMDATFRVVDLRRKLGLPVSGREQDTRLVMIETDTGLLGLIINTATRVVVVHNAAVESAFGIDNPYVLGITTYEGDPVFVFDWDALLASETVFDLNEIFSQPAFTNGLSTEARFLETVLRMIDDANAPMRDQTRHLAATFNLPLSVAYRLITFYSPTP